MVTLERARGAKSHLRNYLGWPPWLRTLGIVPSPDGYCLKVGVAEFTAEVNTAIPSTVDGVAVLVEEAGEIVPASRRNLS